MLDTDAVCSAKGPKLFINATNVRDGKPRIFQGDEITADAILASACLPTLYQAIEIDDPKTGRREAYWDGGYTGNPALYPLFYRTRTPDILIVHINPLYREELPKTSSEIVSRINEISFNASLLRELRNIEFVNRLLDRGVIAEGAMKRNNVHSVSDDKLMNQLGMVTKMTISRTLLLQLKDAGRAAMDALPRRAPPGPRPALLGQPPRHGQLAKAPTGLTAVTRTSHNGVPVLTINRSVSASLLEASRWHLLAFAAQRQRRRRPAGLQRLAEPRQPGPLQERPQRLRPPRSPLRPRPHRRRHRRRGRPPRPRSSLRNPSGSRSSTPCRASVRVGKSARFSVMQHLRPAGDRRRQHVPVVRVRQRQPRHQVLVHRHLRLRPGRAQERDLPPRHRLGPLRQPPRRPRPFLEDPRRPDRLEPARRRRAEQHLAHHRREQHAGVEQHPHGPSRRNSALR